MLSLSEKEQVLCVINKAARVWQLLRATLRMCLSPVKRIKRSHSCRLRSYHASAAGIIAIAPKSSGKMEKAPCRGVCCLPFRPSSAAVRLGFLGVLLQKFCLVHHLCVSASTPIPGCVGKQGNGMDGWKVTERRD